MRPAVLSALLLLGSCGMPDTPTDTDAVRYHIPRRSYGVPHSSLYVSALWSGDPSGRRIIFVHGTPGEAAGWAAYLEKPLRGFQMIAIDRPGFGQSEPQSSLPSLQRQADAIAPLLEHRNGQWPILVGHSLGGPIVAQLAVQYPGKVGGLIILAGSLDPAQEKVHPMQRVGDWPLVRSILPRRLRSANEELLPLQGQLLALQPRLKHIRCAVTIVHGTADELVPYANVAFMKKHLTGLAALNIITLPGQNHFIPWERKRVVDRAIEDMARNRQPPC